MKIFGFEFGSTKAAGDITIDQLIERLDAATRTASGVSVTPENCEESPTVQAIVQAISGHFQALPVHVYKQTLNDGVAIKERLPSHPVAKLLAAPNQSQTSVDYFGDAVSVLVRYGSFFAVKGQGVTGPIRYLNPVLPSRVVLMQNDDLTYTARITLQSGGQREYQSWELHHVRQRSRDFLNGDSPVMKAREAIALEIAAARFGSEFFGNGAMPGLMFEYMENFRGHQSSEARAEFIKSFQSAYGIGGKRFKSMLLPAGIKSGTAVPVDNDKAQFLDTRKLQRNIIAGAFGVPPHLVGDLERGTFSNIEHQSQEFVNKVILPYARMFEAAMERDLLTVDDRRAGIIIRFNLDAISRADFKTRQEGLKLQREMGVINANEWREYEGKNPREGGDEYWDQGPSGQNQPGASNEPAPEPTP